MVERKENGVTERKQKHIIEPAITFIPWSSLPLFYWFDAMATVVDRIGSQLLLPFLILAIYLIAH